MFLCEVIATVAGPSWLLQKVSEYRQSRVGGVGTLQVVRAMHCKVCGAELMVLTNVVPDTVPGVEQHTFICSACHVTERRMVFTRHGREDASAPMPGDVPLRIAPASTVQEEHYAPGLFSRVLARIRGH